MAFLVTAFQKLTASLVFKKAQTRPSRQFYLIHINFSSVEPIKNMICTNHHQRHKFLISADVKPVALATASTSNPLLISFLFFL